jgi:uncharacterized protein
MLSKYNWSAICESLMEDGYAILPGVLGDDKCSMLRNGYDHADLYRSLINMERYRFGKGEYKYFHYPLPDEVHQLRIQFYEKLFPVANEWMALLNIDIDYPATHDEFIGICKIKNQLRPTPLILKYEAGGFNTLHQDLYGEVYFPFQVVFPLSEYQGDYTGGEFVLVQQIPRAQSKAKVLKLNKGDALIFTTNFRPVKGQKGYYRAAIKHGISEVTSGERYALGLIFHDAK